MHLLSTNSIKKELQNSKIFFNAFDEFSERNRRLFNIPEIDRHLFFEDKKNICIINNSSSNISDSYLYSVITNACIAYHLNGEDVTCDNNILPKKKVTLLIDAGNGNNLGYVYLDLVKTWSNEEIDIKEFLKQVVVLRAFTFYQMLNIVINEIPKFIYQCDSDCKIQIIILDLLNTLIESSSQSIVPKNDNSSFRTERDFQNNEKLVNEVIDVLINLSDNYFVILTCDNRTNIIDSSIFYKFSNYVEVDIVNFVSKSKKNRKDLGKLQVRRKEILLKIKSKKIVSSTTIKHPVIYGSKKSSLSPVNELYTSSYNDLDLTNLCVL
ncbi:MAG TPA: hypothetical protein VFG45_10340 [Candidatus Nitrosocosmicus sp.]|nr:hypothetical protein [Candidatus Nitrosocosmicus sp.]